MLGGGIYAFSQKDSSSPPKAGIYAIFAGVGLIAVAIMLRFEAVPEPEAHKMARSYNDRLRAHLGLPPIVEDPTQPHASSPAARSKQRHISLPRRWRPTAVACSSSVRSELGGLRAGGVRVSRTDVRLLVCQLARRITRTLPECAAGAASR